MKAINLNGKIAVVTGGAGQVGRGIVRELAASGADVAICYNQSSDFANKLRDEVIAKNNIRAIAVYVDVSSAESVKLMKKKVNDELGIADIIVINAMIRHEWKLILEQPPEVFEGQFRGFILHAIHMIQAFVPDMIDRKSGRVIGINTECAMQLFPYQSAYAATKRNLDGIFKVLAREIGEHNITVNQVAPGWVVTDNCRDFDPLEANYMQDFPYIERVPLKKRCTDSDIGDAVCFFASDLASCITGAFLPINGGNTIPCI